MKKPKKAKLFSIKYIIHDFIKITASILGLIFFRPKILYSSKAAKKRIRGGALLIGNHNGFFDPVYMQFGVWYRRHHFICMKEFFEGKHRFLFKSFLCIPIDRENVGIDTFRDITEHLKMGELVSMFPQGRIEEGVNSFKSGMILMSLRSGAPIVPMYIKQRGNVFERLTMAIGEPVNVAELCGNKMPSLSRIDEITAMLQKTEEELKKLCEGDNTK